MAFKLKQKPGAAGGTKATTGTKGKTTAKGAVAPKPYVERQYVEFAGYASAERKAVAGKAAFKAGTSLVIVGVTDDKTYGQVLTAIKATDAEQYLKDALETVDAEELFASEVKRTKGAAKMLKDAEKPKELVQVPALKKLLKDADAVEVGQELQADIQRNYILFGGVLAAIKYQGLYRDQYGYKDPKTGWDTFCQESFGMGGRKADTHIAEYEVFSSLPGVTDLDRLSALGTSRTREIARFATAENLEELVEAAEEKTVVELQTFLKANYVSADNKTPAGKEGSRRVSTTRPKKVILTLRFAPDQGQAVRLIIDAAKKHFKVKTDEEAVDGILQQWGTKELGKGVMEKATKATQVADAKGAKGAAKAPVAGKGAKGKIVLRKAKANGRASAGATA